MTKGERTGTRQRKDYKQVRRERIQEEEGKVARKNEWMRPRKERIQREERTERGEGGARGAWKEGGE
eukprot:2627437-Pleurochrysis_carterae.AAC.2